MRAWICEQLHRSWVLKHTYQPQGSMVDRFLEREDLSRREARTAASAAEEERFLRGLLRRVPWWCGGHIRLGQIAASRRDYELAYLSGSAAGASARKASERSEAHRLVGCAALASGDALRARDYLQRALAENPDSDPVREDLASCLMALDEIQTAFDLLSVIPADRRSPQCAAAVLACARQLSENRLKGDGD